MAKQFGVRGINKCGSSSVRPPHFLLDQLGARGLFDSIRGCSKIDRYRADLEDFKLCLFKAVPRCLHHCRMRREGNDVEGPNINAFAEKRLPTKGYGGS